MARLEYLPGTQAFALTDRLLAADGSRSAETSASERASLVTVLRARHAAMAAVVGALSEGDRGELERLLDLVVGGLAQTRLPALRVCRLCDRSARASGRRECPLEHTVARGDTHG